MNRDAIMSYISSSEFNRCKRNGLNLFESRMHWIEVLSYSWLTRKLRRKIGHLFQMGLLPEIKPEYIIGLGDPAYYKDISNMLAKQFMKAEDEFILKGLGK